MGRRLSFRVWHIPSATMHKYLKAKFGPEGMNVTLSGKFKDVEKPTTLTVPNGDLVIMQFTGLTGAQTLLHVELPLARNEPQDW